jgi:dihydroneopterin aldolase
MQEQKFLLLEDALLYFQALLPQKYPQILSLFMKISKPNIIPNAKVSLSQKWTF